MPAGIGVLQRVVEDVGVPVEALRIVGILDNGVRADEPANGGIVVAGVVEVEAVTGKPSGFARDGQALIKLWIADRLEKGSSAKPAE